MHRGRTYIKNAQKHFQAVLYQLGSVKLARHGASQNTRRQTLFNWLGLILAIVTLIKITSASDN
jgi:hypothetical protein